MDNQPPYHADYLPGDDLQELADILAMQLHSWFATRVYRLQRNDIAELVASFIDDLSPDDQRAVVWMTWHLIQDAHDIELEKLYHR